MRWVSADSIPARALRVVSAFLAVSGCARSARVGVSGSPRSPASKRVAGHLALELAPQRTVSTATRLDFSSRLVRRRPTATAAAGR
jgi:hypothetical protein